MAASHGLPDGQVLPAEALRARVTATIDALCRCDRERDVGTALPGLIRDLHTTIAAGRHVAELLTLAAWLHTQATVPWLSITDAPVDLRSQALMLARHAAENRDTVATAGLIAAASARAGLAAGAFDLAQAAVDAVTVPTNAPDMMQLAGFFALRRSIIAAVGRPSDVDASIEYATDLAECTGEGNTYGLGFGRALARIKGHQQDAVMALRRAELISPHRIQRGPVIREVLAELLSRSRRDAVARELRGMAYRAELPV